MNLDPKDVTCEHAFHDVAICSKLVVFYEENAGLIHNLFAKAVALNLGTASFLPQASERHRGGDILNP